jgi:mono/diheme cytochrome c family protein
MPAWAGTLPSEAIWRLVSYLKSIEPAEDSVATTRW